MTLIHENEQEILIKAFLDRGEIRDCFVIEFLLRRGVTLPSDIGKEVGWFLKKMDDFNDRDFKVKLGSILGAKLREHKKNTLSIV